MIFKLLPTVLLLALLALCSCTSTNEVDENDCAASGLIINVASNGNALQQFQLTLSGADIENTTVFCSGTKSDNADVVCSDGRADFSVTPDTPFIMVKSEGYKSDSFSPNMVYKTTGDKTCGKIQIDLKPLADFEVNEDYRTGFDSDNGLSDMLDMSVIYTSELGISHVIKFYLDNLEAEPNTYFINTKKHQLHYDFVRGVLEKPLTRPEYDAQTYHGETRKGLAGTITYYEDLSLTSESTGGTVLSPVTIEFFPSDDISLDYVQLVYRQLEQRMLFLNFTGKEHRLFYLPATDSHQNTLLENRDDFTKTASYWLKRDELYGGINIQLLNNGVAYGKLKLLSPEKLKLTPVSYMDIVVLSRLPNEVPLIGGTITEELQTPLAHVNVAARARGTPNMSLLNASTDERISKFIDKDILVRFEVNDTGFSLEETTLAEAEKFWQSLIPDETKVPEADDERSGLLEFSDIGFHDVKAVGAKAANLAELHGLLPENSPNGFAVPFYYYHQFMNNQKTTSVICDDAETNCIEEERDQAVCNKVKLTCNDQALNKTLQEYIEYLLEDDKFTTDSVFREAALDGLRYAIHHIPVDSDFATLLDDKTEQIFGSAKVRLRSSTNAEDLENFSGAGLYRSVSANGSKDLPSLRIRKVWASVWTWRAFEERSFWAIDHKAVRMGVAVHIAYPDELANGVLITKNLADPAINGFYVNVQVDEVSVTNPEDGALPEIFSIVFGAGVLEIIRLRYSSLSPDQAIMTYDEMKNLFQKAYKIHNHFKELYDDNESIAFDMEFKLINPERDLIIKQTRPYFD